MKNIAIIGAGITQKLFVNNKDSLTIVNPERNTVYSITPDFSLDCFYKPFFTGTEKRKKIRKQNNRKKTKYRVKNK